MTFSWNTRVTHNVYRSLRALGCAYLFLASVFVTSPVKADPAVLGFDLVSSARTGRTSFDYTYRVRVRADSSSYVDAYFIATSTAPGTQVVEDTITLGGVDAGSFVRPADTFTIRQDRVVPFDPRAFRFKFFGNRTGIGNNPDAPQIGPLQFLEDGGRAGHEGSFPMQASMPPGGVNLAMTVTIGGAISSASYRFLGTTNQVLTEGTFSSLIPEIPAYPEFVAGIVTPAEPFTIQVTAVDANTSQPVVWRSATVYKPASLVPRIVPSSASFKPGQPVDVTLQVTSVSAAAEHKISLFLPPGLTLPTGSGSGSWIVNIAPGQTAQISTRVTASSSSDLSGPSTILMEAESVASPANIVAATLDVLVE